MADLANSIEGSLVTLSISTNLVTPAYLSVVCAINNGLSSSADVTTVDTKCGTSKSRGSANYTSDGSFVANHTPGAGEMSADAMIALMDSGANFLFKMEDVDGNYYRAGTGFFSSYNETANNKENVQGDFTIEVIGSVDTTE
jgi:hypothetical protein